MESSVVTGEPKVEDLLASIRRAIDEDQPATVQNAMGERGQLIRGSMHEMRVQFDDGRDDHQDVHADAERRDQPRPDIRQSTKPAFSGILSGRERPVQAEPPYQASDSQMPRRGLVNESAGWRCQSVGTM